MLDFFKKRENKVLVNTSIHNKAKLSQEEFLKRVTRLEGLRTRISDISLFITNEEQDYYLTDLWRLINERDFRLRIFPNYVLFVVVIENKIFNWFRNSKLELIKRQICNWISAVCLANPDSKDEILFSLYEPYRNEVEYIIEHFYSPDFEDKYSYKRFDPNENNVEQQYQLILDRNSEYKSASLTYLNSPHPAELPNPFKQTRSIRTYRDLDSAFPKIAIQGSYIRDDDWLAIVERDIEKLKEYYGVNSEQSQYSIKDLESILKNAENDTMMRGESLTEPWKIWKGLFLESKNGKRNIFDPIGNDLVGGFVYLIKETGSNYYKIGYTLMESGVPSRKSGNQTGNPRSLILVGYFPVSSMKTESALHEFFSSVRKEGEWFELREEQVENILNQEWRIKNHFF